MGSHFTGCARRRGVVHPCRQCKVQPTGWACESAEFPSSIYMTHERARRTLRILQVANLVSLPAVQTLKEYLVSRRVSVSSYLLCNEIWKFCIARGPIARYCDHKLVCSITLRYVKPIATSRIGGIGGIVLQRCPRARYAFNHGN